jgi:hypothetical protein
VFVTRRSDTAVSDESAETRSKARTFATRRVRQVTNDVRSRTSASASARAQARAKADARHPSSGSFTLERKPSGAFGSAQCGTDQET